MVGIRSPGPLRAASFFGVLTQPWKDKIMRIWFKFQQNFKDRTGPARWLFNSGLALSSVNYSWVHLQSTGENEGFWTYILSALIGRFPGTWVRPRWEQSIVNPTQVQARGHFDSSVCSPIEMPLASKIGCPPIRVALEMSLPPEPANTTGHSKTTQVNTKPNGLAEEIAITLFDKPHIVRIGKKFRTIFLNHAKRTRNHILVK